MDINFWAILICAIAAMIIGSLWFGPVFGKVYMRVMNLGPMDESKKKEMQKQALPMYGIAFLLSIVQAYILNQYISFEPSVSGLGHAIMIWLGFIVPVVAGVCMWTADARKTAWTKFFLQAGYQLVLFIVFALILGAWS